MNISPEFQRNLWLDLTPHRLIGMPAVLAGIFFLTYLAARPAPEEQIANVALVIFFVLVLLWGTRNAGDAVTGEIKDRTWDAQRMSSMEPWPMSWGKLFGSTIYSWYGAALCLLVYAYNVQEHHGLTLIKLILLSVAGGVLAQAVALLASLQTIRKQRSYSRSMSNVFLLLGVLTVLPFLQLGFSGEVRITWYNTAYQPLNFSLVMLLVFVTWAMLAIYRLMRAELQVQNTPVVWISFVIFLSIFFAGFVSVPYLSEEQLLTARLFVAYNLLIAMTYMMVFVESKDPVQLRRLLYLRSQGRWKQMFEQLPGWAATLVLVAVVSIVMLFREYPVLDFFFKGMQFRPYLLAAFLFMSRDIGLIIYFNLGRRRKRADMAAFLYLAVLYFLIPSIFSALHLDLFTAMFVPMVSQHSGVTLMAGAVQLAAVLWLVVRRWREGFGQMPGQASTD